MVNLQGTSLRQERMRSYSPTCSKQNNAFVRMLGTEEETKKTSAMKRGDSLGNTNQSAIEAFLRYLTPEESESPERRKAVSENAIRNYELSLGYSKNLEIMKQNLTDEQITYLKEKYDVKNQFARPITEGIRPMSQKELENISDRDENTMHAMNLLAELEARNESIYQTLLSIKDGTWQSWKQSDAEVRAILEKELEENQKMLEIYRKLKREAANE